MAEIIYDEDGKPIGNAWVGMDAKDETIQKPRAEPVVPRNQFEKNISDAAKGGVTKKGKPQKNEKPMSDFKKGIMKGLGKGDGSTKIQQMVFADDEVIAFEEKHMQEDTHMTVSDWKEYGTLLNATIDKQIKVMQSSIDDGTSRVDTRKQECNVTGRILTKSFDDIMNQAKDEKMSTKTIEEHEEPQEEPEEEPDYLRDAIELSQNLPGVPCDVNEEDIETVRLCIVDQIDTYKSESGQTKSKLMKIVRQYTDDEDLIDFCDTIYGNGKTFDNDYEIVDDDRYYEDAAPQETEAEKKLREEKEKKEKEEKEKKEKPKETDDEKKKREEKEKKEKDAETIRHVQFIKLMGYTQKAIKEACYQLSQKLQRDTNGKAPAYIFMKEREVNGAKVQSTAAGEFKLLVETINKQIPIYK